MSRDQGPKDSHHHGLAIDMYEPTDDEKFDNDLMTWIGWAAACVVIVPAVAFVIGIFWIWLPRSIFN